MLRKIAECVSIEIDCKLQDIISGSKAQEIVDARAIIADIACRIGIPRSKTARFLNITNASISSLLQLSDKRYVTSVYYRIIFNNVCRNLSNDDSNLCYLSNN